MQGLLLIAGLAAMLVAGGFLYQCLGAHRDRRRYANPGRWISIDKDHELFVLEQGREGPAVLFESGIAATNLNWRAIQNQVAAFARTAAYDRAGLGWSSPCRTDRTPGNIAAELHAMVTAAGIAPPFVLVGHSFGGLVMRRFALSYPDQVAGLVLVDPMRVEEWHPLNSEGQSALARGKRLTRYAVPIARIGLARLAVTSLLCGSGQASRWLASRAGHGAPQVLDRISDEVGKMPPEVRPVVAAHWSRPGFYIGMHRHLADVPATVREMQEAEHIRNIPVVVLTPARAIALSSADLARIGDRVEQIIAPASAHWIHLDEPELVIDAIREMVKATRQVAVTA